MRHDYYSFTKEELLKNPRIQLYCYETNEMVFQNMAREMVEAILRNQAEEKRTVFICPVGPVGQYKYFVEEVNRKRISLKNVWFLNMDEYLTDEQEWIDLEHPLSFRGFMHKEVYNKIHEDLVMPKEQRVFPDPHDTGNMMRVIEDLGGVDICFGGIGLNGHIAFNEADESLTPEEFCALPTRVLPVSKETRAANAIGDFNGALEDMPNYCVTIGMAEILKAKKIRLGCFRNWHRAVVRRAAYGEPSSGFPITLLQEHPDITLSFTEFVAQL